MIGWSSIDSAPEGKLVMTCLREEEQPQALKRQGNLWFVPDGSMYVYYRPDWWRPLSDAERKAEIKRLEMKNFQQQQQISDAIRAASGD